MKRHNQILSAVLVLQVALIALVFLPGRAASDGERELLLGELDAADVVAVKIEDVDGNQISMRRQGESWVMPDAGEYPVDGDKVIELLEKLLLLDNSRLVTRTEASQKRLQVADGDFLRRIVLEQADGDEAVLFVGSSPSYGVSHVRLAGEDETYLAGDLSSWQANASAESWIDTQYVDLVSDDISAFSIQNAGGEVAFERDAEDNWSLVGLSGDEALDSGAVNTLLMRISSVSLTDPLGKEELPAYGLDQPNAVVTIQVADDTVTLVVGAQDETDSSYVVKSSQSPYYVRVTEFSVQDMVSKTRDDYLLPPPTPESETPAESGE